MERLFEFLFRFEFQRFVRSFTAAFHPFDLFALIHTFGQFHLIFALQKGNAADFFQVHAHRVIDADAVWHCHGRGDFRFGYFFRFFIFRRRQHVFVFLILGINDVDSPALQVFHHEINGFRRSNRGRKDIVHFAVRKDAAVGFGPGFQFQQLFHRKACRHQGKQFFTGFQNRLRRFRLTGFRCFRFRLFRLGYSLLFIIFLCCFFIFRRAVLRRTYPFIRFSGFVCRRFLYGFLLLRLLTAFGGSIFRCFCRFGFCFGSCFLRFGFRCRFLFSRRFGFSFSGGLLCFGLHIRFLFFRRFYFCFSGSFLCFGFCCRFLFFCRADFVFSRRFLCFGRFGFCLCFHRRFLCLCSGFRCFPRRFFCFCRFGFLLCSVLLCGLFRLFFGFHSHCGLFCCRLFLFAVFLFRMFRFCNNLFFCDFRIQFFVGFLFVSCHTDL